MSGKYQAKTKQNLIFRLKWLTNIGSADQFTRFDIDLSTYSAFKVLENHKLLAVINHLFTIKQKVVLWRLRQFALQRL